MMHMNTDRLGWWEIVRGAPTGQSDEHTYRVILVLREMGGPVQKVQTTVQHRYGEGALVLTAKAMQALVDVRNEHSL